MKSWNRLEQIFKHRQLRLLERLLALPPRRPDELARHHVRRILIVRQHDQLGDFLLSTPAWRAVRHRFRGAHITLVARRYTAALAVHHPDIDQVLVFYEHGRDWTPGAAGRFVGELRRGFDLAIVLNTVSHSLTSDLIARMSGAPFILGSAHLPFGSTSRNFFYNIVARFVPGRVNQCERNLDIVRAVGADVDPVRERITLTEQERMSAEEALSALGRLPGKRLIALHPGAGKPRNRWPVASYARLGRLLHERGMQLLVTWGPDEGALGAELLEQLGIQVLRVADRDLRRVAALLSQVDALVCNDTGVMHLAAAVNTPLVAIFGPTDPALWKPPGDRFIALRASDSLCSSVSPERVLKKVIAIC